VTFKMTGKPYAGVWLLAAVLAGGLGLVGCGDGASDEAQLARTDLEDLQVEELAPGAGEQVTPGRIVTVHYTGWLYHPTNEGHKGREFDSSRGRNEPFEFTLGAGQVIPGWDRGVAGMRIGGSRRLTIPAGLAYGSTGAGDAIPPDATLVFDVELLGVR
jgi:FKBP-type peptidyl-prolyl cis-trans isomerase